MIVGVIIFVINEVQRIRFRLRILMHPPLKAAEADIRVTTVFFF